MTADLPGTGADVDLDVTDADAVAATIAGLERLDVAVANAGIGVGGLVEDIERIGWDRTIDVNIRGVVNTVLPAYARLREQASGQLVLTASFAGLAATPLLTPYAMSKAAVVNLGASLRPEAARHGVGVTTVARGRWRRRCSTSRVPRQAPVCVVTSWPAPARRWRLQHWPAWWSRPCVATRHSSCRVGRSCSGASADTPRT